MIAWLLVGTADGVYNFTQRDPSTAYYLFTFNETTGNVTSNHPDAIGGDYTLSLLGNATWDPDGGILLVRGALSDNHTSVRSFDDATPYLNSVSASPI